MPSLLYFTNSLTCAPCKAFEPHYQKVSAELADQVIFNKIDIMDTSRAAIFQEYGVMGTPTVLLLIEGQDAVTLNSRTALPLINEIKSALSA